MLINTTKDHGPDMADMAIEPPTTSKAQPGLGARAPSEPELEPDLESRIKVRRAELIAKLRELRADTRLEATQAGDKLKAKLSEIAHIIKAGVVDGWASLGDNAKHKLEHWLAESKRQLPTATQHIPPKTGQS